MEKQNYIIRLLEKEDFDRGFVEVINQLTKPVNITKEQFEDQFEYLEKNPDYKTVVAYDEKEDKIIGTATLLVERKYIRGCAKKAHIEDVVVTHERRKEGVGKALVTYLLDLSKELGTYKTALVCDPKIVHFYETCGLEEKEREMVKYN